MIKTTGKIFKKFYCDDNLWVPGVFLDGENVYIDGDPTKWDDFYHVIFDNADVTVEGGVILDFRISGGQTTLEKYFQDWLFVNGSEE